MLFAYLALSLLLTWPLILHFGSHVPGDGIDDPSLAWNLWWVKHALVDQLQNPFASNWLFWPVGINLAFYTLTILNGLLSIPLQLTVGTISAYNLLLLSSFVLGGYGAFLLCLEALGSWQRFGGRAAGSTAAWAGRPRDGAIWSSAALAPAAFLGGCLYAFASSKLFYASLGQGNIASSQWIPFAVLYLLRTVRPSGRMRDAALAALFLVLQAYAEQTYASFLLIFALLAGRLGPGACPGQPDGRQARVTAPRRRPLTGFVLRLGLLGALSLLGIAPFLANMLPDLRAEGDFFSAGGGFADIYSADLAGFALPTQLHPLLGGLIRQLANDSATRPDGTQFPVNKGQQIYIGYAALLLIGLGSVRCRTGHAQPPSRRRLLAFGSRHRQAPIAAGAPSGSYRRVGTAAVTVQLFPAPGFGCLGARFLSALPWAEPARGRARSGRPVAVRPGRPTALLQGQPLSQPLQRDAAAQPGAPG